MSSRRHRHGESQGAALLLTLWCVAVVSLAVVAVARLVDFDTEGESARARRFEARELALTGVAHGLNPRLKRDSELYRQNLPGGGKIRVRVGSENARLNINLLLRERDNARLKRLFEYWGVPDADARVAIDSLADWIDPGDLKRLNGAEIDDLRGQRIFSLPRNRDFQSVAEMRQVRGMDVVARSKPDWANFFSVFSGESVDVQDAPVDVLVAAGLSPRQAIGLAQLRAGRDGQPNTADDIIFDSLEQVAGQMGIGGGDTERFRAVLSLRAEPSRVESTGEVGGVEYHIAVVVNRNGNERAQLSWEEQ